MILCCPECGSERVSYFDYPAGLLVCESCGHLFWERPCFPFIGESEDEEEEDNEDFNQD